jgi:hypothetical protein
MRHVFMLLIFFFHFSIIDAQPFIDSLYVPEIGDEIIFKNYDTAHVNASGQGPDQVFDYSQLSFSGTHSKINYILALGTAGFEYFPNADLASVAGTSISYYRITADSFLLIGSYDNRENHPGVSSRWDYGFNLLLSHTNFNTVYTDTSFMTYGPGSDRVVIKKRKFDAYGQLLLPDNTFDTVYRVWSQTELYRPGHFNYSFEGDSGFSFISSSLKRLVFSIRWYHSGSLQNYKVVSSLKYEAPKILEKEARKFDVYPNPFQNEIHLKGFRKEEIVQIDVVNLMGEEIERINNCYGIEEIKFATDLIPGFYILKVQLTTGTIKFKIVKH